MKGRSTTAAQKRFHDLLTQEIGCVACAKLGIFTNYVSIHHIDGRTKPLAHFKVLPLCGPHHQDAGIPGIVAVHPWKARFESTYGRQADLLAESVQILIDRGFQLPDEALAAAGLEVA